MGKGKALSTTRTTLRWADLVLSIPSIEIKVSSGNTKLGNIDSYNITAGTSPYVRSDGLELSDFNGSCEHCRQGGEACKGCYAVNGEIRFPSVQLNNARNYVLVKENPQEYKRQVIEKISTQRKNTPIRIHECGEFFSVEHMALWLEIIAMFPDRKFYAYTKCYDFVRELKAEILALDNFKLNLSAFRDNLDEIRAEFPEFSVFLWDDTNIIGGEHHGETLPHDLRCMSVMKNGKMRDGMTCLKCGFCFENKYKGKIIACYDHSKGVKHG